MRCEGVSDPPVGQHPPVYAGGTVGANAQGGAATKTDHPLVWLWRLEERSTLAREGARE